MIKVNIDEYYWPQKRKKKSNDEINQEPTGATDLEHSNKKSSNVNLEDTIVTNSENCSENKVITGKWFSAWHGSHQYGGWSPEGLSHFNKLVKMVIQDRQNDMHFQAQYEIWLNEGKSKKQKEKSNHPVIRAYWDLALLEV